MSLERFAAMNVWLFPGMNSGPSVSITAVLASELTVDIRGCGCRHMK
jgi:hypothetical protein